jgi:hypothetical protein
MVRRRVEEVVLQGVEHSWQTDLDGVTGLVKHLLLHQPKGANKTSREFSRQKKDLFPS